MSIMIYNDGMLAADRRGIVQGRTYYANLKDMQKLHVSPTKKFAISVVGDNIKPESVEQLLAMLLVRLTAWEIDGCNGVPAFAEGELNCIAGDRCFFVMTKTNAWLIDDSGPEFIDISGGGYCRGNGANMAYIGLAHGLSAAETVTKVGEIHGECGNGMDFITQADLLPMIDPAKPAKPLPKTRESKPKPAAAKPASKPRITQKPYEGKK